jgi:undecaprenyl diphosphate synthase
MPSTLDDRIHVGVIMDGNGRWATARGLPRSAGHWAGVEAMGRTIAAAPACGIATLTFYAFSSANWRRPQPEVSALMDLLRHYLRTQVERFVSHGIRLRVIGRRDRLPGDIVSAIIHAEAATAGGTALTVRIAVDYSGREAILAAARACDVASISRDGFSDLMSEGAGDVDLVIRTSGEQRLSDFLLWESAYAEFYFTDRPWPEFHERHLAEAIAAYRRRIRTLGGLTDAARPAEAPRPAA